MRHPLERELVDLAKRGDEEAFDALARQVGSVNWPTNPITPLLNVGSKILCFVVAVTLFVPESRHDQPRAARLRA
jgi:hypothetical protein